VLGAASVVATSSVLTVADAAILTGLVNFDALNSSYSINDTAAAIVAAAANPSVLGAASVVATSSVLTVADAAILTGLVNFDALNSSYSINDTAAAIVAAAANPSVLGAANVVATSSVLTVANAATLTGLANYDALNSSYSINDTAAAIVAAAANPSVTGAASVVAMGGTGISVADVVMLTGLVNYDALNSSYSVSDTAAAIVAAAANPSVMGAANVVATGVLTVADAAILTGLANYDALNSSYSINDTAASIVAGAANTSVLNAVSVVASSSVLTVADAAILAGLANYDALNSSYSINDTAAAIVAAAATPSVMGAANVVSTTGAGISVADVTTLTWLANYDALNSTYDISDTAAAIVAAAGSIEVMSAVTVVAMGGIGIAVADAAALTGMLNFDAVNSTYEISDTAAAIVAAAANAEVTGAARIVSTSGAGITVADVAILMGLMNFDALNSAYDINDTAAAIVATVDASVMSAANVVAFGGAAITVADAATLTGLLNYDVINSSYDISDTAASIVVAAANASVMHATNVIAIGGTGIGVADAATLTGLVTFDAVNSSYAIWDSAAAIAVAAANPSVMGAASVLATGGSAISVAGATALTGLVHFDVVNSSYSISDTAAAIVAAAATASVTGATKVVSTTGAGILVGDVNTLTALANFDAVNSTYDIGDIAGAIVAAAATASVMNATNVVATGGVLTVAGAATLTGLANFDAIHSSYGISDTAAAIVGAAANASVLGAANVVATSGSISVADAAKLTGLVHFDVVNSNYGISDTAAAIVAAAANASVMDAANIVATGGAGVSVTDAATLTGLARFDAVNSSYGISDTASAIVAAAIGGEVLGAAYVVATSGVLAVADAATLTGLANFNAVSSFYEINDTAAAIVAAAANASVMDAFNVVSTNGAGISVADVTTLTGLANYDALYSIYDISDTAAAIVAAAGGPQVTGAWNVVATNGALAVADAAILTGLANFDAVNSIYDIGDTAAAIVAAAANASVMDATNVVAMGGAALTVADAGTLTGMWSFDAANSIYGIHDTTAAISGALPAVIAGAGMVSLSDNNPNVISSTTIGSFHFVSGSTAGDTINSLYTTAGTDYITGGEGADTINVSSGGDRIDLGETVQATDTVVVAAATSTSAVGETADIYNFSLANDVLDLPSGVIAGNTAGTDGVDTGVIMSHSITNGMISFDNSNAFAGALIIDTTNLANVVGYLEANIANGDTAAFYVDCNNNGTYTDAVDVLEVFQGANGSPGGDIMITIYDTSGTATALGNNYAANTMKIV
jgi:hypothetical protein